MKYFTPELYARGNSPDEKAVKGVEEDWERALARYSRRWAKIRTAFPESVQRFDQENLCLHDAEVLSIARRGDRLVLVLRLEPPSRDVVLLTFTLDGEPMIQTGAFPTSLTAGRVFWLYEEFDFDRQERLRFEVMLSNGCVMRLRFRKFHYLLAQSVVSATAEGSVPTTRIA